jgi:hypothetical protein
MTADVADVYLSRDGGGIVQVEPGTNLASCASPDPTAATGIANCGNSRATDPAPAVREASVKRPRCGRSQRCQDRAACIFVALLPYPWVT